MIICKGVRVGEHDLNQSQVFHGMSQIEIIRICFDEDDFEKETNERKSNS